MVQINKVDYTKFKDTDFELLPLIMYAIRFANLKYPTISTISFMGRFSLLIIGN